MSIYLAHDDKSELIKQLEQRNKQIDEDILGQFMEDQGEAQDDMGSAQISVDDFSDDLLLDIFRSFRAEKLAEKQKCKGSGSKKKKKEAYDSL